MSNVPPARFDPPEPALAYLLTIGWGIAPSGKREAKIFCPLCGAKLPVECDESYMVSPAGVAALKAHGCTKEEE